MQRTLTHVAYQCTTKAMAVLVDLEADTEEGLTTAKGKVITKEREDTTKAKVCLRSCEPKHLNEIMDISPTSLLF